MSRIMESHIMTQLTITFMYSPIPKTRQTVANGSCEPDSGMIINGVNPDETVVLVEECYTAKNKWGSC